MSINEKKEELKSLSLKEYPNGCMLYYLLDKGMIDHIVLKLKNNKVKSKYFVLSNKGYLTSEENFINTFMEFIDFFDSSFPTLKNKIIYISDVLEEKVPNFMINSYYFGDYDYIKYFDYNMKKICVENFYNNIKVVYDEHKDFFKSHGISNKMSLISRKNVDRLFELLQEFVWCCYNLNYIRPLDYLFIYYNQYVKEYGTTGMSIVDKEKKAKEDFVIYYDELINNYIRNIEKLKAFLNKN